MSERCINIVVVIDRLNKGVIVDGLSNIKIEMVTK